MELIPDSNAEQILLDIEGFSIVYLQANRRWIKFRKGKLTTPKAMAKELVKDETHFIIGHNPSPGAQGLEIKGGELNAIYSDRNCLNQIFGRI